MLTQTALMEIMDYSPVTGEFVRRANGKKAGTRRLDGRISIMINYRAYGAHRLAWLYMTGELPSQDIDHIDGNPSNNAFSNLRHVSRSVNMENQRSARADNRSGFLGVQVRANNRFRAEICASGKRINLGAYETPEDAHAAYMKAKRELHVGCTI